MAAGGEGFMTGRGARADGAETKALCYMRGLQSSYELPRYKTTQGRCAKVETINIVDKEVVASVFFN